MIGWEAEKLKYESGEMTAEEQIWYIIYCFENEVVANETREHGLDHDLVEPTMSAPDAFERLKLLIIGEDNDIKPN